MIPPLAVIAAVVLAGGTTAQSAPSQSAPPQSQSAPPQSAPPQSGDARATAHLGNIDIGQPGNACVEVGLPGDEAVMPDGTFTSDGTYIDITAFPPGKVVTGVVVKGGPAYNVYPATALGALPWFRLHAPLDEIAKPAGISHWFVCVTTGTTTTTATPTTGTTPTGTTSTTTPPTTPGTTTPGTTTTTVPAPTPTTVITTTRHVPPAPTTTKSALVGVGGPDDDLAATGFNGWWLLVGGLALLAAGATALLAPKFRRRPRG